jgi:hypothetical protein
MAGKRAAAMVVASAVAALVSPVVRPIGAQGAGAEVREVAFRQGEFRVATDARTSLRGLWDSSMGAKEERVACIGGRRVGGVAYITKVQVLDAAADSAHVSAVSSLNECRPPEWFGTVHTHIARYNGLPFVTFSADDRNVISIWRGRWKHDGVFCILYTEADAYCEAGTDFGGDTAYTETRAIAQTPVRASAGTKQD